MVYNVCYQDLKKKKIIFDVQKKKHGIYSIELICLNGCLGFYLK